MDGQIHGQIDGYRYMDGWIDTWVDRWVDRYVDGQIDRQIDRDGMEYRWINSRIKTIDFQQQDTYTGMVKDGVSI